jgi:hypothetical protein
VWQEMKSVSVRNRFAAPSDRRFNFETAADARKLQTDLSNDLSSGLRPGYYAALADCGPSTCGREHCAVARAFGATPPLTEILAVHRLLKNQAAPCMSVFAPRVMQNLGADCGASTSQRRKN